MNVRIARVRLAATVAAGLLAGCATDALQPTALEDARLAIVAVQGDPTVAALAPAELADAANAYRRAEDRFRAEGDSAEVRHLGYIAQRQAEIALQAAKAKAADQEMPAARAEQERVLRMARERAAEEKPAP